MLSKRSKPFGRNAERPKTHAAVDSRHLRQQSTLAVSHDNHIFQPRIFSLRINLRYGFSEGIPQQHSRVGNGVARIVDKIPELISVEE
jgi:hypothetical protein